MPKRSSSHENTSKRFKQLSNSYQGFVPLKDGQSIDTINYADIRNSQDFYVRFVQLRKPVLINGVFDDFTCLKSDNIEGTLQRLEGSHFRVHVENKVDGGFGTNNRKWMQFDEFLKCIKNGTSSLYLTTQYEEEAHEAELDDDRSGSDIEDLDSESEEAQNGFTFAANDSDDDSIEFEALKENGDDFDDFDDIEDLEVLETINDEPLTEHEACDRIFKLVQKPLTSMVEKQQLKIVPQFLETLIPQQINLWMGCASQNESPEKDILIDEKNTADFGLGRRVPGNYTSSGLHHDHADNLYIPIDGKKRFTIFAPSDVGNLYTLGTAVKVYKSGIIDYDTEGVSWQHLDEDGEVAGDEEDETEGKGGSSSKRLPNFSTIPPFLLHADKLTNEAKDLKTRLATIIENHFPKLSNAKRMTVDLGPGQMLYLPAGWFHEVSSSAAGPNSVHTALNYWFQVPTGDFSKPYKKDYWHEDFARTRRAYELLQEGKYELI